MSTNRAPGSRWARRLARRIADVQRGRGLTQEAFAAECGVTKATFSRWVNGQAVPGGDSLAAIAEQSGVALDWLLRGIGQDGKPCDEPVYLGQWRTEAELAADLAAHVRREVTKRLGRIPHESFRRNPDDLFNVDGLELLRRAAELVANELVDWQLPLAQAALLPAGAAVRALESSTWQWPPVRPDCTVIVRDQRDSSTFRGSP